MLRATRRTFHEDRAGHPADEAPLDAYSRAVAAVADRTRLLDAERIGRKMVVSFLRKDMINRTSVLGAERGQ